MTLLWDRRTVNHVRPQMSVEEAIRTILSAAQQGLLSELDKKELRAALAPKKDQVAEGSRP